MHTVGDRFPEFEEFLERKRFGEVVVRSGIETVDPIGHVAERSQHQNRCLVRVDRLRRDHGLAHLLHERNEITLFEADDRLGGHTNTVDVQVGGEEVWSREVDGLGTFKRLAGRELQAQVQVEEARVGTFIQGKRGVARPGRVLLPEPGSRDRPGSGDGRTAGERNHGSRIPATHVC